MKLEVKQEEAVEVITGLAASDAVEPFKHQVRHKLFCFVKDAVGVGKK